MACLFPGIVYSPGKTGCYNLLESKIIPGLGDAGVVNVFGGNIFMANLRKTD